MSCQVCHLPWVIIVLSVVQMAAAEFLRNLVASAYPGFSKHNMDKVHTAI